MLAYFSCNCSFVTNVKVKVKFILGQAMKPQTVLVAGGWLTPRSGRFTPRTETLYSLYRRLG